MKIGRLAVLLIVLMPVVAVAHHGSAISYEVDKLWTTWATVTQFNYKNPHPTMTFDRTLKDGQVEHWVSELLEAPAPLARSGWTKIRSEEALKQGTRVKLYVGTARAGGQSGIVMKIENEKGEAVVGTGRRTDNVVDLDGVPGGLQPARPEKLPGQPSDR